MNKVSMSTHLYEHRVLFLFVIYRGLQMLSHLVIVHLN